jgi:hypothetical protein
MMPDGSQTVADRPSSLRRAGRSNRRGNAQDGAAAVVGSRWNEEDAIES